MITEERAIHMLSVARKCYELAKKDGMTEEECRIAFLTGWNHDIGYEFGSGETHPIIGSEILGSMLKCNYSDIVRYAIKNHGNPNIEQNSVYLKILNTADLQVDSKGNYLSIESRLRDIGDRYGLESKEYNNAVSLANKIK